MKRLLIAFALLTPLSVNAASFDCQKAQAADEKAICAHLTLNDKDVEMHTKYQFLKGLFAMGSRGALQRYPLSIVGEFNWPFTEGVK